MKKYAVVILALIFSSCLKERFAEMPQEQKDEQFIIEVPQDFTWTAIENSGIQVSITHAGAVTNALNNTLLELYDEDGELMDALTIYDGQAEFNVRIPTGMEKLTLKAPAANISVDILPDASTVIFDVPDLSVIAFNKKDSDRDGLFDQFDSNPFDASKTIFIDNTNVNGTLKSAAGNQGWGNSSTSSSYAIFEDLWPSKGDYDFNDMVVQTSYSWSREKGNYVGTIEGKCSVEFIGAGMGIGLGFELFENKGTKLKYIDDIIEDIDGATEDESVTNGFILFDKIQEVGIREISFTIKLKEKEIKDFLCVPYLFRTDNPGHQVRPFGAPPTEGQKMSLFGSADDASPKTWSWEKGKEFKYPLKNKEAFYRSPENHPWGIEFITKKKFKPSSEGKTILKSYPGFRSWAESGGVKEKRWYEKPE